jgi:hypothetical protein
VSEWDCQISIMWKPCHTRGCCAFRVTDSILCTLTYVKAVSWSARDVLHGRRLSNFGDYRYDLGGPGIESQWGEIFRTRPDQPWGPPGLLHNTVPGLSRVVNRPRRDVEHPSASSAEVKERVELHVYSPLWAFIACLGCALSLSPPPFSMPGHWGDPDVDGRIILRWIFRKLE